MSQWHLLVMLLMQCVDARRSPGKLGTEKLGSQEVGIPDENLTHPVSIQHKVTEGGFALFQQMFPHVKKLQHMRFEDFYAVTGHHPEEGVNFNNMPRRVDPPEQFQEFEVVSQCDIDIGTVIYDVVCLAVGAYYMGDALSTSVAKAIFGDVEPEANAIIKTVRTLSSSSSYYDQAKAAFSLLMTIWSAGMVTAVLETFLHSLSWGDWILYGATAAATIGAACLTDGAAFIAEVAGELVAGAWFIDAAVDTGETC